jgi:hypothetical protein
MKNFDGIMSAGDALNEWFWTNKARLPEPVSEAIQPLLGAVRSPVDACVNAAEIIYAHRADLEPDDLTLGAALAALCSVNGFHGLGEGRGDAISFALRRDAGEEAPAHLDWPDSAADPEPHDRFRTTPAPVVLPPAEVVEPI